MTIYPLPSGWGKLAGWSEADEWSPTPKKIPVKRKSSTRVKKGWQQLAHYRLSGEAHAAIKQLAEKNNVPLGEIVILLLKHGLESYKSGRLKFTPHLKVGKNTLAWDAS